MWDKGDLLEVCFRYFNDILHELNTGKELRNYQVLTDTMRYIKSNLESPFMSEYLYNRLQAVDKSNINILEYAIDDKGAYPTDDTGDYTHGERY